MKISDLLIMSIGNLWRRKLRTVLTVLGVTIGSASVIIMMSLGIGLDKMTTQMYESYGTMTAIDVTAPMQMDNTDTKSEPVYITDDVVEQLSHLENVTGASPMLNTTVLIKQGTWECMTNIVGVNYDYIKNIKVGQGKLPAKGTHNLGLIIGNIVITQFANSKTKLGYWDTGEVPDVDYFNKPLFVIFDVEAYNSSLLPSEDGKITPAPKKYLLKADAVVEGGTEDYNQYAYQIYTDIDALKTQLKKVYKNKTIPGQPTNKKGKPYKYFCYDSATVYCDNMKNVTTVQKMITDMGFQANSQMEWLEQSKKQSALIQAVLGGIGAVSLLVAAIGIANTMMMSIYERTKEIGIMKVLGCDMNHIRDMFLIESGFIGFLGGIVGLVISIAASSVLNGLGGGQMLTGMEGKISQIPLWLAAGAIMFATFVGMLAGLFPSLRAMRLSPLAAIRNE